MTEKLRAIYKQAQQFSEETQDELAARIEAILDEMSEREWERIISQPHVLKAIIELGEEAKRQYDAGETEEGGFDGL